MRNHGLYNSFPLIYLLLCFVKIIYQLLIFEHFNNVFIMIGYALKRTKV